MIQTWLTKTNQYTLVPIELGATMALSFYSEEMMKKIRKRHWYVYLTLTIGQDCLP